MNQRPPSDISFRSRIVPESRPIYDASGNITGYEHNEYLEPGEKVRTVLGDKEVVVFKSRYWHLFDRTELITVIVRDDDGTERHVEMPASAVHRN